MPTPLLTRHPLKHLLERSTVKLLSHPGGTFLGTGFFVTPDKIATCHHVFFTNNKVITPQFSIEGYPDIFTLEGHTQHHPGLDLLVIQLGSSLSQHCINLESTSNLEGARLWGWSYNIKYPDGGGIIPILQDVAKFETWEVFRVSRDIITNGSSGTPVLNLETGKFLGVTYYRLEDSALIIPAQYFQQHFPDLYTENQNHHQHTTYWAEAQQHSRPQRTKRLTLIPPIDNRDVIGRADDLATLRQRLQDSHKVLLMNGIGGIGKTTLAKLYLNNYAEEYEHLLWLEQTEDLIQTITTNTALLRSLNLEQLTGLSPQEMFQQVMLSLQNFNEGLNLLVIDNVTHTLQPYKDSLPHGPHWNVLLTSREQVSSSFELLELGTLEPAAALELFRRHCHKPQDEATLLTFLAQLQYHTLSIELFAKILDSHWQLDSVAELSDYLRHNQIDEDILQTVIELEHAKGETQLYRHLLRAFDLSGLSTHPELILILQRMAALPPSAEGYAVKDLVEWFGVDNEANFFVKNLHELFKLGLLSQSMEKAFSLNRMIALLVVKKYTIDFETLKPLIETLADKLSFDEAQDNPIMQLQWIPYGYSLLNFLDDLDWDEKSSLLNDLALAIKFSGDYDTARELLEKALAIDEIRLGGDHSDTITMFINLASVLHDLGDYLNEQQLLERALATNIKHFGPGHKGEANIYSTMGSLSRELGQFEKAQVLLEKAVNLHEKYFGDDHPYTTECYSRLALVLRELGDFKNSKILLEKSLNSEEKHFGNDHPRMIWRYSNLALLHNDFGDPKAAATLLEKSVYLSEKYLGPYHPYTLRSCLNLALALLELGESTEAYKMLEKVVPLVENHYGLSHPETANAYANLGDVHMDLGNYLKAKVLMEKAVSIDEKNFGSDHPTTAKSYSGLAKVHLKLGDYKKAKELSEKVVLSNEQNYGLNHPNTGKSYTDLAIALQELGDYTGALKLMEKVVLIEERNYGEDHPNLAVCYSNLGVVLWQLEDYERARILLEKAIALEEQNLGPDHPDLARNYSSLALIIQDLGDYKGAQILLEKAVLMDELNYGEGHSNTALDYTNLAFVYQGLGDITRARTLLTKAHLIYKNLFGPDHPYTQQVLNLLQDLS